MKLNIGDSVKVKQGIKEPDLKEFEISGWQGRVTEIDDNSSNDEILITIEWDSLTLEQLPSKFIELSEIDELDWSSMVLYQSNLNKTESRDKIRDVEKIQEKVSDKYYWASFGEEGKRISKVLGDINRHNELKCFELWDKYLEERLVFPIKAIVDESEDNWIIKSEDVLTIKSLSNFVDMYGIITKVRFDGKILEYPLCDLEIPDKESKAYQLINDYRIWFSNK